MESVKCKFCCYDFKPGTLVEGKCTECAKKYPDADSMQEWKEQQNPKLKESERVIEERVDKAVERKLKEIGILTECVCGKFYYKKSPAQKACGIYCTGKKEIENNG